MIKRLPFLIFALLVLSSAATFGQQSALVPSNPPPSQANSGGGQAGLSPAEAQRVTDILQDPQKRVELIATLQAIAKASPQNSPAAPAATVSLMPDSLGEQLLAQLATWPATLAEGAAQSARAITDFPALWHWGRRLTSNPEARAAVIAALWQSALIVGLMLLLEWLAWLFVRRLIARLAEHAPIPLPAREGEPEEAGLHGNGRWQLSRRVPFALARLALDLIPIGIFWGAASLLAGIVPEPLTRLAVLIVISAYATTRVVLAVGLMLVSPSEERLRLVQFDDEEQPRYLMRWLRRVTVAAVFGVAIVDLAALFGLYKSACDTLMRIVALIVAVLLSILVFQARAAVARRLRAPEDETDGLGGWRNRLAGVWHYLAWLAITAGWVVWASEERNEYGGLRRLIGTLAILIGARLLAIIALGVIDRVLRLGGQPLEARPRVLRYRAAAILVVKAVIAMAAAVALLQLWGVHAFQWFAAGHIGARLVSAAATVAIAIIIATGAWEGGNVALERRLTRLSAVGGGAQTARLRTLLPILRTALFCSVVVVVGLTALSEIGVNIAPLLAGAGIIGVAIGFGSQKLVQDVITGMFVLFENAIQVGDVVTVAGLTGTVERLSVRNIWLRGGDGALHSIPFSAVTSITNTNRGLGNAAVSVTVAYCEDSDRVTATLREIANEMRGEPAYEALILGDLQIWVDAVKAWGVTFAGQIACTDIGRWTVQREFNRRLQQRFREVGIELSDWYAPSAALKAT
jgi:small-conductance mechanosensitive channel